MSETRLNARHGLAAIAFAALLALAAAFACALPATAHAEQLKGADGWYVAFNAQDKMVDNFSAKEWADDLSGMQPGDDITFQVQLRHENADAADWYMSNEVLKTLEQQDKNGDAAGSVYEYLLTYTDPDGKVTTLYDSSVVGGDKQEGQDEGLLGATNALQDFFFLDNLAKDEKAHVTLKITMDGETEQNAYFDTLAQVKMKFAVEKTATTPAKGNDTSRTVVRTGDDTNMLPAYLAMAGAGLVLLVLAIVALRRRKFNDEEDAR